MVKSHKIASVGTRTEAKCKNHVRWEVEEYLEWYIQVDTKEDLEVKRKNMQNYIGGPFQINTMMLLVKKEIQTSSKLVYLNSMEARVWFQHNPIAQFGEVIAQYKYWHHHVT